MLVLWKWDDWEVGLDWSHTTICPLHLLLPDCIHLALVITHTVRIQCGRIWEQIGLLPGDATAWGCWYVTAGGYARLTQAWWRRQDLWSIMSAV